jgi:hypothetical protein
MWVEAAGQDLAKLRHFSVRIGKNHKTGVTMQDCDASLNPQTAEFKQDCV